jgi:cell division protein ZapA
MKAEQIALDVIIMGREYRVSCTPGEREALLAAVNFLDTKMRDVAERTQSMGERLAVMTALNIAHEMLQLKQASGVDLPEIRRRIGSMNRRIEDALASQEQLF